MKQCDECGKGKLQHKKVPFQSLVDFLSLKKGQEVLVEPIDRKKFQVTVG